MQNPHDRKGVFRRHLFQVVRRDLLKVGRQVLPNVAGGAPDCSADWASFLQDVCQRAFLQHHSLAAHTAALELGVALRSELVEVCDDIGKIVGMKPLELRRFRSQLAA